MDDIRLGSRTLEPHRQLLANGRREPLGKRALDILSVLADARGKIVTKDELFEAVWPGVTVEENALQVHIVALRKALGPEADRLKTIRGVGYQLDVDPDALPSAPNARTAHEMLDRAHPEPAALLSVSAAASRAPSTTAKRGASGSRMAAHRIVIVGVLALGLLTVVWALFGAELGLRPQQRIPVIVKDFAASNPSDPSEVAVANGITDELINRLRRIRELRVATVGAGGALQQSSFSNAFVVEGSVRRSGDQLRVMARLADAKGEILWSQTFNRRLAELLAMQERIATSIADVLSVSLDVGADSTAYGGTDNPEAYAAFLEARAESANLDQSVPMRLFDRALALDPDYIQALAYKSINYDMQVNLRADITRRQALALLAQAGEDSGRALALNPGLWIGHYARAWYHFTRRDLQSAIRSGERMKELDRGNEPELLSVMAGFEGFIGRESKALALLESAELLDPATRQGGGRVMRLLKLGRPREAIELAKQVAAGDPAVLQQLAVPVFWSYLALGEEAEGFRFSEQYGPGLAEGLRAFRADRALPAMSPAELRQWANKRFGEGGQMLVADQALYAGYAGHPRLAVELMRVAFERPGVFAIVHLWFPAMAEARKTDEFERLVTDIGLVKIWRESNDWSDHCRPVSATEITCH